MFFLIVLVPHYFRKLLPDYYVTLVYPPLCLISEHVSILRVNPKSRLFFPPFSPVTGSFPVLLQLPNGHTLPVAIPASIASSSVHIPTAIPVSCSLLLSVIVVLVI